MAVDGCGAFCKYVLVIFNVIFAVAATTCHLLMHGFMHRQEKLVGCAFLGLGMWLRFSPSTRGIFQIEGLNSSTFVVGVTVLIALGIVMLIVVSFGDYGACSEKRSALQVFAVLVTILALAEGVVGFLAYSQRDEVGMRMAEFYTTMYGLYVNSGDPGLAVTLLFIHNLLHCCGITGVSLIEIAQKTCPDPDGFLEHIKMPSCPMLIASVFDSKALLVMGVFVGTGVLLIVALACSAILLKQIKKVDQGIAAYYSAVY